LEQVVRVKYKKDGPIRYISHLNLVQVFTRALRRANIPVAISCGFNPRFRISFGPPLPLGIRSISEYLDIRLEEAIINEEIMDKLNQVLPLGLEILQVRTIPSNSESLVNSIDAAFYLITFELNSNHPLSLNSKKQDDKSNKTEGKIGKNIKDFLNLEKIIIEKHSKKGIKQVDIRPSILDMSIKKYSKRILDVDLRINIGQNKNLNPRYVIKAWLSYCNYDFNIKEIYRYGLYIKGKEVIEGIY
jgi:radical SAM-linked protein